MQIVEPIPIIQSYVSGDVVTDGAPELTRRELISQDRCQIGKKSGSNNKFTNEVKAIKRIFIDLR